MKTRFYIISTLAAGVIVSACNVEVAQPEATVSELKQITIVAESGDAATKTELQSDGSVYWRPADEISVFYGSGTAGGSRFISQNTEIADLANFVGSVGVITGGNEASSGTKYFWGVYPYSSDVECDGEYVTATLPDVQDAVADSFADDLFLTVGRAKGLRMAFYNVCGGVKFSVTKPGVKSVTFRGNNGEVLAGRAKIGFGDNLRPEVVEILDPKTELTLNAPDGGSFDVGTSYYFVAFPTVLTDGLTMTFNTEEGQGVKEYRKGSTIAINRSKFGKLTDFDSDVQYIDYITFPDANFRKYILANYDDDEDGRISMEEAANITIVNCMGREIETLKGIERCKELTYLNCSDNNIKSLDLANLTKLETITCYGNPIENLNIKNDAALLALFLQNVSTDTMNGSEITISNYSQAETFSFDFSGTPYTTLSFTGSKVTKSIYVNNNVQLNTLNLYGNSLVHEVLVSNLSELRSYDIHSCALDVLDVTRNTKLVSLTCDDNQLIGIDLDNNVALETLICAKNQIPSVKLVNNVLLKKIDINSNLLQTINVRSNTALEFLNVSDNTNMTTLNVTYNTALSTLYARNIAVADVNLRNNTVLKVIDLRFTPTLNSIVVPDNFSRSSMPIQYDYNTESTGLYNSNGVLIEKFYLAQCTGKQIGYGVVYKVTNALSSADAISATDYTAKWEAARSWANKYGNGLWYLPARNDYYNLNKQFTAVNNMLSSSIVASYMSSMALAVVSHWTSELDDSSYSYIAYVSLNSTSNSSSWIENSYHSRAKITLR